jgi:hypothetical protein
MIHFSKCKIPYPHDFEDYPCRKCNAFLMITSGDFIVKGKTINIKIMLYDFVAVISCLVNF